MDSETIRLRQQITHYLTPAKNKGFYLCPLCGSGQGPNQTGALHLSEDKLHIKCFSCGFYGDLIDLVGAQYGLAGAEAFHKARELLGVSLLAERNRTVGSVSATAQKRLTPAADFSEYLEQCAAALPRCPSAVAYLRQRGFTDDSIRNFRFGYDETTHQLVIPYGGDSHYFIRRGLGEAKHFYKPPSATAGPEPLFGEFWLHASAAECIFVVESQLCALSLAQEGVAAVALGGGGSRRLLACMAKHPSSAVFALALDNDTAGEALRDSLQKELVALGCKTAIVNPAGPYKDPNEALQKEPAEFKRRVATCVQQALAAAKQAETAEKQAYEQTSAAGQLENFLREIRLRAGQPALSTGFSALDAALGGGFYEGLYILGALSSLGKTTFALQLADQIAAQERDVLFFSLEMSRHELMAKSLSRLSREATGGETANTVTARAILQGKLPAGGVGEAALLAYRGYADRLFIQEGEPEMTVNTLWKYVREHLRLRGQPPVVVVDYLQILAPLEARATDKQNTDRAVFELKRMSRELQTPVLAISSLNRENYSARMSMGAFKESGAIEYSSDVLMGLQFRLPPGAEKISPEALEGMKQADPRELELKVLKNRNGPAGTALEYDYFPRYDLFLEQGRRDGARRR